MSSVTERSSLQQTRQLAFIAKFTTDMRYVKGETNLVADALWRPTVSFIDNTSTINYKDLSTDQALDTEFTRLRHSKSYTMNFKLLKSFDNKLIWCDVSTGHIWPYVTAKFRKHVFSNLHGLGHADGFRYLLTCADRFTRWPEAIPLVDIRAETVANAFFSGGIARFRTPATITTVGAPNSNQNYRMVYVTSSG